MEYKNASHFEIRFHSGKGEVCEVWPAVHLKETGELVAGPYYVGDITIKDDPQGRGALVQRPEDNFYSGHLPLIPG